MQTVRRYIKDLGELTGDVLVFGGPYSNLQATKALFKQAKARNIAPSHRICTGDAVAYCGDPVETLALINGQCEWLAGNCEKQLAVSADDCGCGFDEGSACDLLSRGWYPFTNNAITHSLRQRLTHCPDIIVFRHGQLRYAMVHGGFTDISRFIWSVTQEEVFKQEIASIEAEIGRIDVVLAGHSGIAFQRKIGSVTWLNSGVIGMPANDGKQTTQYVVLTDSGPNFEALTYDVEAAINKMRSVGLTQGYEIALETGFWPSQDILPPELHH